MNSSSTSTSIDAFNLKIGREGELYAYKKIKKMFIDKYSEHKVYDTEYGFKITKHDDSDSEDQLLVKACWKNINGESNDNPDIIIIEKGVETNWEIKSTFERDYFRATISPDQWRLAAGKRRNFYLYFVSGIEAKGAVETYKMCDPATFIETLYEGDIKELCKDSFILQKDKDTGDWEIISEKSFKNERDFQKLSREARLYENDMAEMSGEPNFWENRLL